MRTPSPEDAISNLTKHDKIPTKTNKVVFRCLQRSVDNRSGGGRAVDALETNHERLGSPSLFQRHGRRPRYLVGLILPTARNRLLRFARADAITAVSSPSGTSIPTPSVRSLSADPKGIGKYDQRNDLVHSPRRFWKRSR